MWTPAVRARTWIDEEHETMRALRNAMDEEQRVIDQGPSQIVAASDSKKTKRAGTQPTGEGAGVQADAISKQVLVPIKCRQGQEIH